MKYSESANLGLLEQAKPTGKPLISGEFGVGSKATNLVTKNKRITVLVVDDHPIVLDGLTAVIDNQPDMLVIAEASDGISAVVKYREHRPDVVVMDLRMPGLGGVEAILQIRREFPGARIIVLTTYEGDEDIHRALEAGARAYLLKDMVRIELLHTIREVIHGQRHLSPGVAARLAEHPSRTTLSDRELQVLNLVAKGLRNKEIGAALDIAEDTVKIHVKNIFGKLDVIDRTQAVVTASQRGFIRLECNE
jgi:DNA-binding NarL/FixJ family response regulator